MTRFFDRIVATARTELATSLHTGRAAASRPAPLALTEVAGPDNPEDAAPRPPAQGLSDPAFASTAAAEASRAPEPIVAPPVSPRSPHAPVSHPAMRDADVAIANPVAASSAPPPLSQRRAVDKATALAGAWFEVPGLRPPRSTAHPSLPAVALPAEPTATRVTSSTPVERVPPSRGAAPPPAAEVPVATAKPAGPPPVGGDPMGSALRDPSRERTMERNHEPRPVASAPRPVNAAPQPVAPRTPPPSHELHIEHLDVRIVSEAAPRAPVTQASTLRGPSQLGAWRPFARRFLGRR